jgi:hypothetical protein
VTEKKFTIRQFIDAMEENGYEHKHDGWFDDRPRLVDGVWVGYEGKPITAACIMGQAAINLGIDWNYLAGAIKAATDSKEVTFPSYEDGYKVPETSDIASAIMTLNDGPTADGNSRRYSTILKKAKEWLEPFADREVTAIAAEYKAIKKADRKKRDNKARKLSEAVGDM